MKLLTNIYIDTSTDLEGDAIYERLELFDFETIELTSSLQDVRDIGSVFTDFSQQFNIPASQANNKILKHFYDLYLTNGYDSRVKRKAFISLNGITFREGYIRLSEAVLSNGQPKSYSITFFGQMVTLKDILGDDELKELNSLANYNHEYSIDKVYSGFKVGLGLDINNDVIESTNRDLIYPSISVENKWFYDTSGTAGAEIEFNQGLSKNLWVDTDSTGAKGIDYSELKPAIKVKKILEAIEYKYASIDFSDDFFSRAEFNNLYMLLHNKKGSLTNSTSGLSNERTFWLGTGVQGDYTLASGTAGLLPIETNSFPVPLHVSVSRTANVSVDITALTATGSGSYTVDVLDSDNNILASGSYSDTSLHTLSFVLATNNTKFWGIRTRITSNGELTEFTLDTRLIIAQERIDEDYYGESVKVTDYYTATYSSKQGTMVEEIVVYAQLPKITIVDFLKGLFKTFNLTAYVENGVIVVKTLNQFYFEGVDIDLSDELDISEVGIKRSELFSNIAFKYSKPTTFGVVNQNEVLQMDFGNLEFQTEPNGRSGNLVFDGGKYEVKLPFEKLFYERLSDEADLSLTPFSHGWLVDKDQNATATKPVLFFNIPTTVDDSTYKIGFKGKAEYVTQFNRASNATDDNSQSLNFGEEIDEYTGISVTHSLFDLFYRDYISSLFDKTSRIVKYTAILKLKTLLSYKMNNKVFVNGLAYRINTIKTNLTSGKSEVELISDFDITSAILSQDATPPSVPTNLAIVSSQSNSLNISWTASTDNVGVTGYEIYSDGVLRFTVGLLTSYEVTGLVGGTAYDIQLLAIDDAGNKSAKTSIVVGTTSAGVDTTPPNAITNLSATMIDNTSINVSWTTPFDNVGVTGYDIDLNQSSYGSIGNVTSYYFTGLTSSTTYRIALFAKDLAGNISNISNIIDVTTNQ